MGCGAAKATQTNENNSSGKEVRVERKIVEDANKKAPVRPSTPVPRPKPVAFEIPSEENDKEQTEDPTLVKKNIPRRLQRLEEQTQNMLTVQDIEEKQQKAEERRQGILEERVNKSRSFQQKFLEKTER
ncbi:hypothetical protein B4U80_08075, partial [Leptotrombidium deliense]